MEFNAPAILPWIAQQARINALDALPFGVIGFDEDDIVTHYNRVEAEAAGLRVDQTMGRDLFVEVAPCMNNFMVSDKFDASVELDEIIDYVLTLRMKPTSVKLRLLNGPEGRFILVDWRK